MGSKCVIIYVALLLSRALWGQASSEADSLLQERITVLFEEQLALERAGKYEDALPIAQQILEESKAFEQEQDSSLANAYSNVAILYWMMSKYDEASALFEKALYRIEGAYGKTLGYASTLNNLATVYERTNRLKEAEVLYREVLSIYREEIGENHLNYAQGLNNLALVYKGLERYALAEELYKRAISIFEQKERSWTPDYGLWLSNLGTCYLEQELFEQAARYLEQALKVLEQTLGKSHPLYANTLDALAKGLTQKEAYSEARATYQHVLTIYEKTVGTQHDLYAITLYNLASVEHLEGLFVEAETHYKASLNTTADIVGKAHPDYIKKLNGLLHLQVDKGDRARAKRLITEALALNLQFKEADINIDPTWLSQVEGVLPLSQNELFITFEALFRLYEGEAERQAELCRAAMYFGDLFRRSFERVDEKVRIAKIIYPWLERALSLQRAKGLQANLEEVLQIMERNKSLLLADALNRRSARQFGGLPDSLAKRELALQNDYSAIRKERLLHPKDPSLLNQQNRISLQLESFQQYLQKAHPNYYALRYTLNLIDLSALQEAIGQNVLFLEYFVGDTTIYTLQVTKQTAKLICVDLSRRELEANVSDLHRALSDYEYIREQPEAAFQSYAKSAHWFYEKLLKASVTAMKKHKELLLVLDGKLGYLPFESFLKKLPSKPAYRNLDYLVNDHAISYSYSAALLLDKSQMPRRHHNGQLLAMAPSYQVASDTALVMRSTYLRNIRNNLMDLPAAQAEVEALLEYFNGRAVKGTKATESFFKKQAPNYSVLHLAMHGLLNEQYPVLSSLAFSEDLDSLEDNFLEAWEISALRLSAELVVLSACETGYGRFQQGEGIQSLARAFMYAGVPSLVVSLWQVNDASTRELMERFYAQLAAGKNKAIALQEAKKYYIQNNATDKMAHPAYWAPFVQLGATRPLTYTKNKGLLWIVVGSIALAVISFGGIWWWRKRRG